MNNIFYVKDYLKNGISDSEAVRACLSDASGAVQRTVVFDGKDYMLDEAVVLESNTCVIIDNCTLKQNDRVFDNIFRGANVKVNPDDPYGYPLDVSEISNIKIEGRGYARLVGTEVTRIGYHPGRDEYQSMSGDFWGWRTMMITFALGSNIEISGLELSRTMCWAVTFEWCSDVYVHDLAIYATVKNGDGIDFRSGCHHCKVENISGYTSDDTVACTALSNGQRAEYPNKKSVYPMSVAAGCTHGLSNDIHDIEVKGIKTGGLHHGMICLAARGNQVYNISISDFDEAPVGSRAATVAIYTGYADGYNSGDIHNITINNIHSTQAEYAVEIRAEVRDIIINNIVQDNSYGKEMVVFPNSKKKVPLRVALSTAGASPENTDEKLFAAYRDGKVGDMELSTGECDAVKYDFKKLGELSYKYGIKLASLHLPFQPFEELDISKPELADRSVELLSELMLRASGEAGINRFVIHPSGEPISDDERSVRMECAKSSLKTLADVAKRCGAVIAVENLPRTCLGRNSEEILELISADQSLRVCFDTNHLLSESHESFIRNTGKYIVTTHISDYDFIDERHLLPGEGKIDWQKLISDLMNAGYTGPWLYELGLGKTSRIERERDLTPADFKKNATELFTGEAPTLIKSKYLF